MGKYKSVLNAKSTGSNAVGCANDFKVIMKQNSNLRGIFYMLISTLSFVLNDSIMKWVLVSVPPYEVLVIRGGFGIIWGLGLLCITGEVRKLPLAINRWVCLRGALEIGGILTYILALLHASLADATAIFQTTPLLVILGLMAIHREPVGAKTILLVLLGFIGAILVAQPNATGASPYIFFAFLAAIFASLRDLAGRRIPSNVPVLASTFMTIILVMLGAAIVGLSFESWVMPSQKLIAVIAGGSFLMVLAHVFTFLAYRHASAQAVAPFIYSYLIWAIAVSYLAFNVVPNSLAIFGMAFILMSGLAIVYFGQKPSTASIKP
jgi:drug/metabolite transporter (DMT)-like permease